MPAVNISCHRLHPPPDAQIQIFLTPNLAQLPACSLLETQFVIPAVSLPHSNFGWFANNSGPQFCLQ